MSARDRGVSTESRTDLDAEGPLRRWVRRKREVAREKEAEDEARRRDTRRAPSDAAGDARESTDDASEPSVVEEKVLTDEDMPPLDSLDENSDYSGFLSSGVSETLRRRALRKLFSSAVFNIPDGLDDYDDDFTSFAALGDIVTSDMKHQAEMEAERAKRAQASAEPSTRPEEESREGADDRPAPDSASDDAAVRADADPADAGGPSEPAAVTEPVTADGITDGGAAGDGVHVRTGRMDSRLRGNDGRSAVDVIPAKAGIHGFSDQCSSQARTPGTYAGDGERSVSPPGAGRLSGESVANTGSPADPETTDEVHTAGPAEGEAGAPGERPASSGHPEDGSRAPAAGDVPAKAGKGRHQGA